MSNRLLIINPNSSEWVTDAIRASVEPLARLPGNEIECIRLPNGPPGIDTAEDVAAVVPLIMERVRSEDRDAYVLACFSDPGIRELRRLCRQPIFGIGECAYLQAMSLGECFGVISTTNEAVSRHQTYVQQLGFQSRLAADLALGVRIVDLPISADPPGRLLDVGRELVDRGADVIILGCAGMSSWAATVGRLLGVPVVEPCAAAVQIALTSLESGGRTP